MPKPKCINCGHKLMPMHGKEFMKTLLCPLRKGESIGKLPMLKLKIECNSCSSKHKFAEFYTRDGLKILLCTEVKAHAIKTITGRIEHVEIMCNNVTINSLNTTFQRLTEKSTLTLKALVLATQQTISPSVLLENANLAIQLGLPANQLDKLFESAFKLGLSLGLQPEKAITSLVRGIGRQSIRVLDNLGIVFKANEAYEHYKQKHKLAKLTYTQKREVWISFAIEQVKEKAKTIG